MSQIDAGDYQIITGDIGAGAFRNLLVKNYADSKKIIIVDENTHENCLEYFITNFPELSDCEVVMIPAGEENKVLEICFQVWEAFTDYQVGRKDLVINIGGGLVTDLGGFVASVYKRGMDYINIPTSLLGMVDASIGGKTGIDLGSYKNMIGTFSNPQAVFIDTQFLKTLPLEELLNGYAEMLKHALIADKAHWEELKSVSVMTELINYELIEKSINIKNGIVLQDPLEEGLRKSLNFGHTAGHALEGYFISSKHLAHGHAVGLGMLVEAFISFRKGLLSEADFLEIEELILESFPLVYYDENAMDLFVSLLKNDKKNYNNDIHCCLLTSIGSVNENVVVTVPEFMEAFIYLKNLNINLN